MSEDSKAQQRQKKANESKNKNEQPGIDRRLNGPNRPAE
ncbi:hypothetical protein PAE9249_01377 [Paenibacillus sp. CECT 9249]|nr:hypothetical protein PAE9249_01377 [Paenibacillus sp. CECT 9249]